jgi:hypothetical protein
VPSPDRLGRIVLILLAIWALVQVILLILR